MSRDLPARVTPVLGLLPHTCILSHLDMPPVEGDSKAFTLENDEETEKYMNVDEDTVMDAKTAIVSMDHGPCCHVESMRVNMNHDKSVYFKSGDFSNLN